MIRYIKLTDLVEFMFPPLQRHVNIDFNDWNYWKSPLPIIEVPLPIPVSIAKIDDDGAELSDMDESDRSSLFAEELLGLALTAD